MDNIEALRDYCLLKKGFTEELPFGPDTLVFKVMGKIFAIAPLDEIQLRVNLKCDPERALELREQYSAIQPGYHMNKLHWNTIVQDGSIPGSLLKELIDHSYNLIVESLPRKTRNEWEALE